MCTNAIEVYATREGISEANAIDKLNSIYMDEAKKKVPTMANIMQNMGLNEKKARQGKKAKTAEAPETTVMATY